MSRKYAIILAASMFIITCLLGTSIGKLRMKVDDLEENALARKINDSLKTERDSLMFMVSGDVVVNLAYTVDSLRKRVEELEYIQQGQMQFLLKHPNKKLKETIKTYNSTTHLAYTQNKNY